MTGASYTRFPRAILWLIREGEVTIGGQDPGAQPPFSTRVASFYLGKTPITNLQYEAYDPGHRRQAVSPADDDPAVGVDFRHACGYCEWYAGISRKPIRLPTEVEWEYACRGATATRYFFGDDPRQGEEFLIDGWNSGGRLGRLADRRPNPFGLLGMLGGVWEWTSSLCLPYPAEHDDGRDDPGADGPRALRGGSFRTDRRSLGSAVRRAGSPDLRRDDVGFRIARSFR